MIIEVFKVLCFIFFLCSVGIYLILKAPVDENARLSPEKQKKVVRTFFLAATLMILYGYSPFFEDLWYYHKFGDTYPREKTCVVDRTYHLPFFSYVKREVLCKDERITYKRYLTFDDYESGERVRFLFLPESRTILKIEVIE